MGVSRSCSSVYGYVALRDRSVMGFDSARFLTSEKNLPIVLIQNIGLQVVWTLVLMNHFCIAKMAKKIRFSHLKAMFCAMSVFSSEGLER